MLVLPAADSPVIQKTRPGACIVQIVTLKTSVVKLRVSTRGSKTIGQYNSIGHSSRFQLTMRTLGYRMNAVKRVLEHSYIDNCQSFSQAVL